jgi:transposase-like protein
MAQKNKYLFRGRFSERKFRQLLRLFAADITADRAALLTGLHHNTTLAIFHLLRLRMADLAEADCPFHGQIEIDESYFGPSRVRGQPGRGAGKKTPVFGILERGGRVHCQIVKNCSKATLSAIIEGRVHLSAEITTDGFRSYDGLVEAGFKRHHRILHGKAEFARDGVHINGIESFWSYAKRRHQKFNGLRKASFSTFLKETEFRFNTRDKDLYKILLRSCRMKPLRR